MGSVFFGKAKGLRQFCRKPSLINQKRSSFRVSCFSRFTNVSQPLSLFGRAKTTLLQRYDSCSCSANTMFRARKWRNSYKNLLLTMRTPTQLFFRPKNCAKMGWRTGTTLKSGDGFENEEANVFIRSAPQSFHRDQTASNQSEHLICHG